MTPPARPTLNSNRYQRTPDSCLGAKLRPIRRLLIEAIPDHDQTFVVRPTGTIPACPEGGAAPNGRRHLFTAKFTTNH